MCHFNTFEKSTTEDVKIVFFLTLKGTFMNEDNIADFSHVV